MKAEKLIPDEKDKQIIKLLIRRVSYRDITQAVCLSIPGIKKRIKVMKDYYSLKTTAELINHLQDSEIL